MEHLNQLRILLLQSLCHRCIDIPRPLCYRKTGMKLDHSLHLPRRNRVDSDLLRCQFYCQRRTKNSHSALACSAADEVSERGVECYRSHVVHCGRATTGLGTYSCYRPTIAAQALFGRNRYWRSGRCYRRRLALPSASPQVVPRRKFQCPMKIPLGL